MTTRDFTRKSLSRLRLVAVAISISIPPAGAQVAVGHRGVSKQPTVTPFEFWQRLPEARVLNLFNGFSTPTVTVESDGVSERKVLEMSVYTIRSDASANRAAVDVDLGRLLEGSVLRELDPNSIIRQITSSETMPKLARPGNKASFSQCRLPNEGPFIRLSQFERTQDFMSRPHPNWCEGDLRRVRCFEVCSPIPPNTPLWAALRAHNSMKSSPERAKDLGLGMQAEVRIYNSEAELGAAGSLVRSLTGVNAPIRGMMEISFFYFNQMIVFGKMLAVVQVDPSNPQRSLVTGLSAYGLRRDSWNYRNQLVRRTFQNVINGESELNLKSGILAGVPTFSQNVVNVIARSLSKN